MSSSNTVPETMEAVIFKEPYKVSIEKVPRPKLQNDGDVILKVHLAGLCGSDLHLYRGHEDAGKDYIMGHEVVGTIIEKGKAVKKFEIGDIVAVPFTVSCGSCWYCSSGHTARCNQSQLFGTPSLQGCQAEYVRIPLADGCVFKKPDNLPDELMLLMADILPTGYSAASNARSLLDGPEGKNRKDGVCVVIGCGPVGLCAISSAKTLFSKVFATDLATSRLALAEKHGAIALPSSELKQAVLNATEGRGADAVLEVVGHEGALLTALDLVRPYGAVSSVGVHSKNINLNGGGLYDKNVKLQFGRCSVRTFYQPALKVLVDNQEIFKSFIENKVGFSQAAEYYELFEKNKVAKTVFVPGQ
ncbi:uncharacterized protein I206_105031 [Kwoniella pini CBS 10737]|uniref:Alcohol dehydrogenase n=1 Tax=Kwoniella pini CBS 10737 TaxID=1296096 RepID=A0A1B9I8M7_9TREE|nr:alcohol dehydrogenase [Kwoniella pini CBS 10737]OCF51855.1 alcohol dehydrogenase [Kwoniella pini CBS 10737]